MMAGHRLILPFTLVRPMILTGSIPSLLSDQPIDHSPDSLSAFAGINRFPLCQERRNSSDHSAILFATTFPCDIVLAQHALRPHPLIHHVLLPYALRQPYFCNGTFGWPHQTQRQTISCTIVIKRLDIVTDCRAAR